MLRMPRDTTLPETARRNLDRFRRSGAAAELERDPRIWLVADWPWADEAWNAEDPLRVNLRSDEGEWIEVVVDQDGCWRRSRIPIVERLGPPS